MRIILLLPFLLGSISMAQIPDRADHDSPLAIAVDVIEENSFRSRIVSDVLKDPLANVVG